MKELLQNPIFFERNRVFRVYTGGKLFSEFFGDEPIDNNFPEEWICSAVPALNDGGNPTDGLSIIKGANITFDKLILSNKNEILGDRENLGILVKVLDSAVRLPLQAHPDKAFSKKYLSSDYGKTEMWLVLATRENAHIFMGFDRAITKEEFINAIDASKTQKDIMQPLLSKIYVKPGDIYLIPATMVHAIGYGCLILEVQEPTDFTIQPEYWCENHKMSEFEKYLNLPKDIAIDCFNFSLTKEQIPLISKKEPKLIKENSLYKYESLISYAVTPCFSTNRITINGSYKLENKPAIYIVINGDGKIYGENKTTAIKKGNYFFIPYSCLNVTV